MLMAISAARGGHAGATFARFLGRRSTSQPGHCKTSQDSKSGRKADPRKERLAAELRANLQKRKAQSRSRRTGAPDARPDGLQAAETKPPRGG